MAATRQFPLAISLRTLLRRRLASAQRAAAPRRLRASVAALAHRPARRLPPRVPGSRERAGVRRRRAAVRRDGRAGGWSGGDRLRRRRGSASRTRARRSSSSAPRRTAPCSAGSAGTGPRRRRRRSTEHAADAAVPAPRRLARRARRPHLHPPLPAASPAERGRARVARRAHRTSPSGSPAGTAATRSSRAGPELAGLHAGGRARRPERPAVREAHLPAGRQRLRHRLHRPGLGRDRGAAAAIGACEWRFWPGLLGG